MKATTAALLLLSLVAGAAATEVICYWGSWSHYRSGNGQITVDDLDPSKCTMYIYSFAKLSPTTYQMEVYDQWLDISLKGYEKFVAMKQQNPALKVLIALGGWNDSQGSKYSTMLASPSLRASFISGALGFLQQHGFDGLDLDYEFPSASDRPHFAAWVTELAAALRPQGLLLTAAVHSAAWRVDAGYDVPALAAALDLIHVMTYDLHGSWEAARADHHAPLLPRASDAGSGLDVQTGMQNWVARGAPAARLAMGVPLYGRSWRVPGSSKTPPAAASGAGTPGPYTAEQGYLGYMEICEKVNAGWTAVQDPSGTMGPYAYSGDQWVGYDDIDMVATKTRYAIDQGFGGVMVWDAALDDIKNLCGDGAWPLLSAIQASLGPSPSTSTPPVTSATSTAGTTFTSSATTAATAPTTAVTAATTAPPGGAFVCPQPNGLFPDPTNCQAYYNCGHGTPYHYVCPSGTLFDPVSKVCNWASQVSCA